MPIDREAVLRTADRLLRQGKLEAAIAEYVRLTEDQPRDWNSINALGDLYVRAGQIDRAVAQFVRIADHLFDEGFLPKAAALYKKALKVKQDHEHTLLRLSDIAVRQELLADAKLYLRQLAQQRQRRGDERGVSECVLRLGEIDENDGDAKIAAARAATSLGDSARAVTLLQEAAEAYRKLKRDGDAMNALMAAADLAPGDEPLRASVARALIAAGEVERAQPFISASAMAEDPDLLLAVARKDLIGGRVAEASATLMRVAAMAPDRRDQIAQLAEELGAADRQDEAYACVDVLVDASLFEADFDRAVTILQTCLARGRSVAALLKLVDVYVDAGLDTRINAVQEQLANAYLENGQAAEARVVAEDLVARAPQVEANVERLRRALIALGVEDVEGEIARQLDVAPIFGESLELPSFETSRDVDAGSQPASAPVPALEPVTISNVPPVQAGGPDHSVNAGEPPRQAGEPRKESYEIDLSAMLAGLNGISSPAAAAPAADADSDPASLYNRAQECLRRGETAAAEAALQSAARAPQWRFRAAAQLGQLAAARGDLAAAVEWLERAASAPSPSRDEGFAVLYDLADTLHRTGEPVRALAVFMELEADAGIYRDVRMRIDHLTSSAPTLNGERP